MKPSKISIRYAVILALVAFCCTSFSVGIYWFTKDKIDNVIAMQERQFLNEVIPQNMIDNDILATCKKINLAKYPFLNKIYIAKKDHKITAYAIQSTAPDGYSGDIMLLQGFEPNGLEVSSKILGVRVLQHNETPGLGDKIDIRISNWILSFNNKKFTLDNENKWKVKKDGGKFDQFTGATITPRAVVNNIRQSAKWFITQLKPQSKVIQSFPDCD